MPKGFKGWAIWGAAQVAVTYAIKLLIRLADNAMMGWGDDRLAELFGITSPNASTVFNWAVPFVLAAVTLWLFHHFTTRPLKAALANQSGGDRFSATGVVYGPSARTWIQQVEPYHIIILGFAIAGAGVIWLVFKSQEDPRVAQLQAQVSVLQQHLSKPTNPKTIPAPATAPSQPSQIKPRYNDGEIREMIDVMGTLRRIVDQEIAPESWKARPSIP
jgi:hypothetical protein